ncbi:MAG: DUF115 domain-containing protein [Magnetococcales bacterium]|nr:DUF115 domain-containing protein [Magnetococcales bacterium]
MSNHADILGPFLTNRFGERYLPSINGETFSQVGSDSFYQRHYGPLFDSKESLFTILGTDGGLLLHWILSKTAPQGTRFIFIELPELIDYLSKERLIPERLPPHVGLITLDQWQEQAGIFSLKDYFYVGRSASVQSLGVVDGFYFPYVQLNGEFHKISGQMEIELGQEVGAKIFMLRGLENLAENRWPLSLLHGGFVGKTAILMAGGPSLDSSFEWIRTHRRNIVLLSVARIGAQLKREGIVPDLIYAIDPHAIIFHQSKDILSFDKHSLLVNMYHLNSRLLGQWCGQSLYMGPLFSWATPLNVDNPVYPGITVSHQVLGSAINMGFSQVVLCGFDLCFDKEGFTHASGSQEVRIGPSSHRSDLWVETNGGWLAETSPDFFNAIPALSQLAEEGKRRGCRVINPAKGSAKIGHVEHVPWEEISPSPLEASSMDMLKALIPKETRETRMAHYAEVEKELFRVRGQLTKIQQLTAEARQCNQGLFGRKNKPMDYKFKLRMDAIEASLDADFGDVTKLVKKWNIIDFLRLGSPDKDKTWSDAEIERAGERYYQVYHANTVDLIKTIDLTRQRIRTRMEAEKERPAFKSLLAQWQQDGQPGRAQCFLDRHQMTLANLPPPVAKLFHTVLEAYHELLHATETDYKAHCDKNLASPTAIRTKALSLLHKQDFDKLANFMNGIQKSAIPDKDQFVLLIQGYLADHEQDYATALDCFGRITLESLIGESLRCLLSVHLKRSDLPAALATAEKLAELSAVFVPALANLQRLNGMMAQAATTYTRYLTHVPKDLATQVRLGMLYAEMGENALAVAVFEDILRKDPDNKAARLYLDGGG